MQQNNIDLHLLVPCRLSADSIFTVESAKEDDSAFFMKMLDVCNNTDFSNRYVRNLDRHSLGEKYVCVTNAKGQLNRYPCFSVISIHSETKLAVVDIVVPSVTSGADRIVEFFRSKHLTEGSTSEQRLIDQWLKEDYGLLTIGEHRCIVFSGIPLDDNEKINFLAAECEPMGRIVGNDFKEMSTKNIAQYDTAEAYVSEVTLLEISKDFKQSLHKRLTEQAIEVFFIKLLLLQDAAISSVNMLIEEAIEDENNNVGNTNKELLKLVTELSKATKFFDSRNFYYPTVRASSLRIAEKFGLSKQMMLMRENKSLLEQLIDINTMRVQKKENDIINIVLIILTVIQVVPIVFGDRKTMVYTGIVALACIAFIILIRRKLFSRRKKHNRQSS